MSQDCAGGDLAVKTAHIGCVPHEIRTSFPTLTALAHANAGSWLDFPDQDISKVDTILPPKHAYFYK